MVSHIFKLKSICGTLRYIVEPTTTIRGGQPQRGEAKQGLNVIKRLIKWSKGRDQILLMNILTHIGVLRDLEEKWSCPT